MQLNATKTKHKNNLTTLEVNDINISIKILYVFIPTLIRGQLIGNRLTQVQNINLQ